MYESCVVYGVVSTVVSSLETVVIVGAIEAVKGCDPSTYKVVLKSILSVVVHSGGTGVDM